jgi:hypothetical protein
MESSLDDVWDMFYVYGIKEEKRLVSRFTQPITIWSGAPFVEC